MTSKRQQQEAAGLWLRSARERRGFQTAGALARRMGVSGSLISRYETGISAVSDERAEQIADALDMNIIDVRRGLGLWVPADEPGTPGGPASDRRPPDEVIDDVAALRIEIAELREEIRRERQERLRREGS